MSGYATLRPRWELLEVLSGISAWQDGKYTGTGKRWGRVGAWCITRQRVIIAWYARLLKRYGRPAELCTISRRTLNYQLAGLERDRYIERTQRHRYHPDNRRGDHHPRAGKLDLRPSLYKFTTLGKLWIKRHHSWVENPLSLLAVQRVAQSGFNSDLYSLKNLSRSVDKSPTDRAGKPTKKSAAMRRPVATLTSRAVRRPAKAPVRKGPKPGGRRARSSPARRSAKPRGKATRRRRQRS